MGNRLRVENRIDPLAPLATTAEMRSWLRRALPRTAPPEVALRQLLGAMLGPRGLDLEEVGDRTGTAAEVFRSRRANCVGFAFLFLALARELEIPVFFVALDQSAAAAERRGDLRISSGHLAVGYGSPARTLVFDFGGMARAGSEYRKITDHAARAIFHSNRGASLLLAGRTDAAAERLRAATEMDPSLSAAWSNLGVALLRSGELEEAEAAYRRAFYSAPESLDAWRNLALLLERRLSNR